MNLEPLGRLRTVLASFPADLAYDMSELQYNPTGHDFDWVAIESSVGVGLPTDYKRLMDGYGDLVVGGIFIVSPEGLLTVHKTHAAGLHHWLAGKPERSWPIHPERGGLLMCASTEGRDVLWWDTSSPDPDQWSILWDVEFNSHTFDGTLTELLIADLTGELEPQLTDFTVN